MKAENSKLNEPHKFVLNLPQILNKFVALQNYLFITRGKI